MKIVEYTVNINSYDKPRKDIISIDDYDLFRDNGRNSRAPKILSHKFIDADVSIYWDANTVRNPNITKEQLVKDFLGDCDIAAMRCTTGKTCVYQEIEGAKTRVKILSELKKIEEQEKHYRKIGIPENIGTLAGYIPLIRRHNDIVKRFNDAWWAEMCRWSYRDQISFPVILSQFPDIKINWVDFTGVYTKLYRHSGNGGKLA